MAQELNQRNLSAWPVQAAAHGFTAADLKPWGGLFVRWDGAAWIKATEVAGERATAIILGIPTADSLMLNTLPDDAEIAGTGLTEHTEYYPAADGDMDTTVNGTPIAHYLTDGIIQFKDAHEPEPVTYAKLRLTATRVVNAGETLSLAGATKGEANGTAAFAIDADRNADITLKATAAEHDLDDEIFITGNRGVYQPDDFAWVDANTFTAPERFDPNDVINIKQRI